MTKKNGVCTRTDTAAAVGMQHAVRSIKCCGSSSTQQSQNRCNYLTSTLEYNTTTILVLVFIPPLARCARQPPPSTPASPG